MDLLGYFRQYIWGGKIFFLPFSSGVIVTAPWFSNRAVLSKRHTALESHWRDLAILMPDLFQVLERKTAFHSGHWMDVGQLNK